MTKFNSFSDFLDTKSTCQVLLYSHSFEPCKNIPALVLKHYQYEIRVSGDAQNACTIITIVGDVLKPNDRMQWYSDVPAGWSMNFHQDQTKQVYDF